MGQIQNGTYTAEYRVNGAEIRSVANITGDMLNISNTLVRDGSSIGNPAGIYTIRGNSLHHCGESYSLVVGGDWFSLDGIEYRKKGNFITRLFQ